MQADAFVESIGINTHLYDDLGSFGTAAIDTQHMQELGIRHIRDSIRVLTPPELAAQRAFLQTTGARMDAITNCPPPLGNDNWGPNAPALMKSFVQGLGGAVELIEAANEPDNRGMPDWQSPLVACIKGVDRVLPLPFVAPAMAFGYDAPQLGDIADLIDVGAIHSYFGGHGYPGYPGASQTDACGRYWSLDWQICEARVISGPADQLDVTETGYTTPLGVDAITQAKYDTRVLFVDRLHGIARTYLYELQDDGTDAADREDGFGVLHHDGSPKPSFYAVRSVIRELADPGPPFTPTPLRYAVDAPAPTIDHEAFEKRDGEIVIALWDEVASWSPARSRETTVAPRTVAISFAVPPTQVTAQQISDDGELAPETVKIAGDTVSLSVADRLTFLALRFTP